MPVGYHPLPPRAIRCPVRMRLRRQIFLFVTTTCHAPLTGIWTHGCLHCGHPFAGWQSPQTLLQCHASERLRWLFVQCSDSDDEPAYMFDVGDVVLADSGVDGNVHETRGLGDTMPGQQAKAVRFGQLSALSEPRWSHHSAC